MGKIQIFLDSDVVIAALLSKTGASCEVIQNSKITKIISQTVQKEIQQVALRLKIENQELKMILKNISVKSLNLTKKMILAAYQEFVFDEADSHVVAGAKKLRSRFLLTHNLRHYQIDKIKARLGIIVLKPGNFLQYLRSLSESILR